MVKRTQCENLPDDTSDQKRCVPALRVSSEQSEPKRSRGNGPKGADCMVTAADGQRIRKEVRGNPEEHRRPGEYRDWPGNTSDWRGKQSDVKSRTGGPADTQSEPNRVSWSTMGEPVVVMVEIGKTTDRYRAYRHCHPDDPE